MKIFLFALLLLGPFYSVSAQDSLKAETPEQLGELIFKALKTNDFLLYESLLITEEKHAFMLNAVEATDSAKEVYRQQGQATIRHIQKEARENFDNLYSKPIKNGIDWNKVELVEVKHNIRRKKGIEYADLIIVLRSEEKVFFIGLEGCGKSDTWMIMQEVEMKM